MNNSYLIKGDTYRDKRGIVSFVNDFGLDEIRRFYVITHPDLSIVRAWQAHKFELKYFYCLKGEFLVNLVRIDNWSNPSMELNVDTYKLKEEVSQVLYVPSGYATGFKALRMDSQMLIFSNKTTAESKDDDFRYNTNYWFNWQKV